MKAWKVTGSLFVPYSVLLYLFFSWSMPWYSMVVVFALWLFLLLKIVAQFIYKTEQDNL